MALPNLDLTTKVVRSSEPVFAEMGNEIVMMSLEQSEYYGLDATGSRVWELISQPITVSDLCQRLVQVYAVNFDVCQEDTMAFLAELHDAKLIALIDSPGV